MITEMMDPLSVPDPRPGAAQLLRASDSERASVVQLLSDACGEGRLSLAELDERLGSALAAAARDDLEGLTADLPGKDAPSLRIVTVMGSHERYEARMAKRTTLVTVFGRAVLDLRSALIHGTDSELRLYLLGGRQVVIVPDEVEVHVSGSVLIGATRADVSPIRYRPGRPRINIRVIGALGEVRLLRDGASCPAISTQLAPSDAGAVVAAQVTNEKAIASLAWSLAGLIPIIGMLGVILGLSFGFAGLGEIKRSGGTQPGRGLALAGVIISAAVIAGWAAFLASRLRY
jgi:hypothetical protein